MKIKLINILLVFCTLSSIAQKADVQSPNGKIRVGIYCEQNDNIGNWFLKVGYSDNTKTSDIIPKITLGISRADQNFVRELKLLKAGKALAINEQYTALHGKRSLRNNSANELTIYFENPSKAKLNL